jgi:rhodanese-related sulfurtransferase
MANKKILAGIVATIAASLCCVTPVLAVLAGSSSLASSFSWMEPYHNYLVGLTILILLYAWWDKLRVKTEDLSCACDEDAKTSFYSSKTFLAIVTVFAVVMLTFPQWGYGYVETEEACNSCVVDVEEKPVASSAKVSTEVNTDAAPNELPVLKYISDAKAAGCADPQACSGIGYKEADKLMADARAEVKEMIPTVLSNMLENDEDVIVLDIREANQRAEGEIYASDTLAVTRGNLEFEIMNKIKDKDAVIVAYCRLGGRSLFAAQTLQNLGYKNVYSLAGGLKAWALAGLPFDNGLGIVVKVVEE